MNIEREKEILRSELGQLARLIEGCPPEDFITHLSFESRRAEVESELRELEALQERTAPPLVPPPGTAEREETDLHVDCMPHMRCLMPSPSRSLNPEYPSEANVEGVESRLKEFENLEQGWLDGEQGAAPSREGLGWVRGIILALMVSYRVPLPHLYPTPEGGVQAEWSFKPWEVSAEFNLLKRSAYLHAVKGKTRETKEDEVTFEENEDKALERTAGFVLRIQERGEQA